MNKKKNPANSVSAPGGKGKHSSADVSGATYPKANQPDKDGVAKGGAVSAALSYAARGWYVFPADKSGKKKSHKSAKYTPSGLPWGMTIDAAEIRLDFAKFKGCNVAIVTGEVSGIFVLECDTKAGHDVDGAATLAEWEKANGELPKTLMGESPSGSVHRFFKHPGPGIKVWSTSNTIGPGVDCKGDGGMVIAPPSLRPDKPGGVYRWLNEGHPIADAPQALLDVVCKPSVKKPPTDATDEWTEFVHKHGEWSKGASNSRWRNYNSAMLGALSAWVPALLPKAETYNDGYRVTSADLGRSLEEDLAIMPNGIRDHGHGKGYTAIDLVMEYSPADTFNDAVAWLTKMTGIKPRGVAEQNKLQLAELLGNAAELQTKTFADLNWIAPNILPEGLTIMVGKPKVGKSWLALDLAISVAMGALFLGQQCEQGDVLALFLEDSDRRLQRRMTMMLGAQKEAWPENLEYATRWYRLADGGIELMREWIGKVKKPRLLIVDILERVRNREASKQTVQYSADYEALVSLQKLATEFELSILVLHHQRKAGAEDLMDTISGTGGIGGAVDSVLVLGKDEVTGHFLYGRGRELEEFTIAVKQNEQCRWDNLGPKSERQVSPERDKIVAALRKANAPMTVDAIAVAVGGKKDNVKNLLVKMLVDNVVVRVATGVYRLPSAEEQQETMDLVAKHI